MLAAFVADPLLRWVWPDDDRWVDAAGGYFASLLDRRLLGGEAWTTAAMEAVALWEPPGGLYRAPPGMLDFRDLCTSEELARLDEMDAFCHSALPAVPHWYLGILAVDPAHRRLGYARRVISPILASADRTSTPVVLDTGKPRNVEMYGRFGFRPVARTTLGGADGPTVTVMERQPTPKSGERPLGGDHRANAAAR